MYKPGYGGTTKKDRENAGAWSAAFEIDGDLNLIKNTISHLDTKRKPIATKSKN